MPEYTHHCTACGFTLEEHPGVDKQWPPVCCPGCDCQKERVVSGADDLREAIGAAIENALYERSDYYGVAADAVLALLADRVRRLAILNLIGDVKHALPGTTEEFYVVRPRGEATDA